MLDTPGIYALSEDKYHADPAPAPSLSNSVAKILLTQSPLHARLAHPRLNAASGPDYDNKFDIGTAAHMMFLERRSDAIEVVTFHNWTTKAAKEARANARAQGRTPILQSQYDRTLEMVAAADSFLATTELAGIRENGFAERTVIWLEGPTWCRCRPDLMSQDIRIILDYKTTESSEPEAFIRQIGRMQYDLQAEWYIRGIRAVKGINPVFVFLVQEIHRPYACSLVSLSNTYRALGQDKCNRALERWGECVLNNTWPGYSTQIHYAEPPSWAVSEMLEEMDPDEVEADDGVDE
jgi:hypothetical protein